MFINRALFMPELQTNSTKKAITIPVQNPFDGIIDCYILEAKILFGNGGVDSFARFWEGQLKDGPKLSSVLLRNQANG